jgi:hypothetical protein
MRLTSNQAALPGALWVDRVMLRYRIGHPSAMRPDSVSPWTKVLEERNAHDLQLFRELHLFRDMAKTKYRKRSGDRSNFSQ